MERFGRAFDKLETLGNLRQLDHAFQFQFQGKPRTGPEDQADRQYEWGMRSLDKRQWDEAAAQFDEAAAAGKGRADGAMYWKAYALMKLGRSKEATAALDELGKHHPQSRWLNDAKAMRVEIAQAGGRPVSPEDASDDEIKIMAINGLMNSDPERSIPLLEKILTNHSSPKLRVRALFVLSQSGSLRVAKEDKVPHVRGQALFWLAQRASKQQAAGAIHEAIDQDPDTEVKKKAVFALTQMPKDDGVPMLIQVARANTNPAVRKQAMFWLGNRRTRAH